MDPTFTPPNCLAPDVARIFCRLLKKGPRKAQIAVNSKSHKDQLVIRMNTHVLFTLTTYCITYYIIYKKHHTYIVQMLTPNKTQGLTFLGKRGHTEQLL